MADSLLKDITTEVTAPATTDRLYCDTVIATVHTDAFMKPTVFVLASSFGTGVATALALNVGSAGAPVTFNGALGTPSSGTLTNATGLPAAGVVGTAAILGANTFTALQTHTQASANAGIIASTGYSLTSTNTVSMVTLAGTLNGTGIVDVLKLSITNTATNASSKLLNLYAGASGTTSVFSVGMDGSAIFAGAISLNGTLNEAAGWWTITQTSVPFRTYNNAALGWTSSGSPAGTIDTTIGRVAAGVVGIGLTAGNQFSGSLKLTNLIVGVGGSVDLSAIAAGSPNLVVTATSDTPGTAWNVVGTANASAAPSGYLEISVGGNARYIPFFA